MSHLKKTRNETIRGAICAYLERRNYPETEILNCKKNHSAEQMATASIVLCESSRANSILFSSINNDAGQYDIQYTRLVNFIKDIKSEKVKNELYGLLSPLLCHMYLEMLRGGHGGAAQVFLKRHSATLPQRDLSFHQHIDNLPSALYRPNSLEQLFNSLQNGTIDNETTPENDFMNQILDNIGTVFTLQEIESKPIIAAFRSNKYEVNLSQDALNMLKAYLAKHGHVILILVLQTWFHIDIFGDNKEKKDEDDEESLEDYNYKLAKKPKKEIEEDIKDGISKKISNGQYDMDTALRELQETIKSVRDSYAPLKLHKIATPNSHLLCAKTDPRSTMLAAGLSNSEIRLWDLGQSNVKKIMNRNISLTGLACNVPYEEPQEDDTLQIGAGVVLRGHRGPVLAVNFLSKEGLLFSASQDCTLKSWRLSDYSCVASYSGHSHPIWCMDVSKSGLFIATGSFDKTVRLWSLNTTFQTRMYVGHNAEVTCVKFHPNEAYLASGSADRSVRLWTVCDGRMMRVLWHRAVVRALAFSPCGSSITCAGDDKKIKVWDIAASTCIFEYKGHHGKVVALDWSSAGQGSLTSSIALDAGVTASENSLICSSGMDGIVRVFLASQLKNKQSSQDISSYTYNTKCSYVVNVEVHPHWVVAIGKN